MTTCKYCGTNGDHYCPNDVARGPEDEERRAKQAEIDEHMSKRPFLAETPTEAERMAHAGRSWPALKESKSFDNQRLNESPLFKEIGGLFK